MNLPSFTSALQSRHFSGLVFLSKMISLEENTKTNNNKKTDITVTGYRILKRELRKMS